MTSNSAREDGAGDTPIRDAACLILIDRAGPAPRMLMGRRLPTQVFLPNKWVFPGGRVDDDDRALAAMLCNESGLQRAAQHAGLAAFQSTQAPFALTAIREMFEETGLFVGHAADEIVSGLPPAWQAIVDRGLQPDLDGFRTLARAITPPGLPRRFDTYFFMAEWAAERAPAGSPDGELLDLAWFTVEEARALDLAYITRLIVDDVAIVLDCDVDANLDKVPFYYQDVDVYRRVLVDADSMLFAP
ncbi:MAG: NUDIX hydrolase [Hyphomicrobium sp.]